MKAVRTQWAAAGFEAARRVSGPGEPGNGRLHGHSFRVELRTALPDGWGGLAGVEAHALQHRLQSIVAPFHYGDLNEVLEEPSDLRIVRWIARRMDLPEPLRLHLWAGPARGATLDAAGQGHVWLRDRFEAAHRLPHVPPGHKCGRMHGHGFEVVLHARAGNELAPDLRTHWQPLRERLHMVCLNDIPGLEIPTSEMLAGWIWARLAAALPSLSGVTVFETASCGARFDGRTYRIWKDRSFDSAALLGLGDVRDPRRRLHGHTYLLRLVLSAPLDSLMGWTVDFGDVKALFSPVFQKLDHHPLHEILPACDVASILDWIRLQSASCLPALQRIDLRDTPATGAILSWGGERRLT